MKTISFTQKLIVCLIGGLIGGLTFLRASDFVLGKVLPPITLIITAVSMFIGCIAYIGIWQWRDIKGIADNARIKTFWIGAIRYVIAFDLALFGFQKMVQMERFIPLGVIDEPFSSISGSWLTWSYFGRSYAMMVTVGILQLLGALLLLFHRTRLAGVLVLTPIMLTIVLIEYFYDFEMGDLIHAVTVMAGLLYLLALDYKRIIAFFSKSTETDLSFQTKHTLMKHVGRMSILFIPVLLIVLKP